MSQTIINPQGETNIKLCKSDEIKPWQLNVFTDKPQNVIDFCNFMPDQFPDGKVILVVKVLLGNIKDHEKIVQTDT